MSKVETIYVDSLNRCHRTNDGTMRAVETDFFAGRCEAVVEGYNCDICAEYIAFYPWKSSSELDNAQREYERQLIATYEKSLETVGVVI